MWFSGGLGSIALIIALNNHKGLLQPKCFSDSIILQANPLWGLQLGPAVQVKLEEKFLIAPGCWLEISAVSSSWVCLQPCAYSWHWKSSTRHIYPLICNRWLDMPWKGQAHHTWPQTPLFPHLCEHTVYLSSCSSTHKSSYFQCPPVIVVQSNNSWRPEFAAVNGKSPCITCIIFKWAQLDHLKVQPQLNLLLPQHELRKILIVTSVYWIPHVWLKESSTFKGKKLECVRREVKRKMVVTIILRNSIDRDCLCLNEHIWGYFYKFVLILVFCVFFFN